MTARTFVDALGAMRGWINSRTTTLVGQGRPLQLGAHLKKLSGGEPATYAFLEEQLSTRSADAPENMDMVAVLSAQVYGGAREAATNAAVALAEELSTELEGRSQTVGAALVMVTDDVQGPSWFPDGDIPRLLVNWTVRLRPQ
jgi:hypothetical protein